MPRVRELMQEFGYSDDYVGVNFDAANACNGYSRQQMLNLLVERVPSLDRFINLLYGGEAPYLAFGEDLLHSREGTQQGDPVRPCFFSV